VTDQQHPSAQPSGEHDSTGWVILGVVLIVAGFFLGARNLGIIPWPLGQVWELATKARVGVGIVLIGVLLIWWAQSGKGFAAPRRGVKLYRSTEDKWLAGVLGGLASYFGMDATLLRLAFIALVVLFDVGGLVVAYIVMAIVVPQVPKGVAAAPPAQAWPNASTPPAAPAPPASGWPVAPAPPEDAPEAPAPPDETTPGQ
jgi:phage shock protein PspC (stress-responsive transcriptional regulator)